MQSDILASIREIEKKESIKLVKEFNHIIKYDRFRFREAEMIYQTFYDGGSEHCKQQYSRHI